MRLRILPLAALLLLVTAVPAPADAPEALARLRGFLARTQDFTARFTQTTHLVTVDVTRTSGGRVTLKKGGKMRWTYEGEDPQHIVSDGTLLWIHQVRDRTVIRREVAKLSPAARLALDLLSGLDGVDRFFDAASCGADCVALTPKKPDPELKRVEVQGEPGGQGIRAVVTVDPLDNVTRVEFSDVKLDTGIGEAPFDFVPPPEAEVLDEPGPVR